MTLMELLQTGKYDTDKQTIHDYVNGYYEYEFSRKQNVPITLLEIGVGKGYSIALWRDYFKYPTIIGIDVLDWAVEMYRYTPNVKILQTDAYSSEVIDKFANGTFDYIIDDGPHTLQSQLISVDKWLPKIKHGGKLIIEDVENIDFAKKLENHTMINTADVERYRTFDLRKSKGRYDDIIFEVTKK